MTANGKCFVQTVIMSQKRMSHRNLFALNVEVGSRLHIASEHKELIA